MNELITQYAMRFVGIPYIWGGNNPITGLDCSGFVLEILRAFGFPQPDLSANDIYVWCLSQRFAKECKAGSLVFFGKNGKVTHVALALSKDTMIEAGGGGPTTTSMEESARHNAYVRLRPIASRKDFVGYFYPPYL
jgi:peptidoglycan DL-endopeptidase CwlO